jgi:drug/metabolite transporter (DMT)-like permease
MLEVIVWLILCAIWGTTWIFIKIGLEDLPPITFAAFRFTLAAALMGILINRLGLRLPDTRRAWVLAAGTGFLQFAVNFSAVFWSEQYITSGLGAVLQATITLFGLILARYYLSDEKLTLAKVTGVVTGIAGIAIVFMDQLRVENRLAFFGCVAVVIGSFAAAQASILVKAKGGGIHPASLVFAQMVCGLPFIIAYAALREGSPLNIHWTPRAIGSVLYLSLLGTIAAFWLYYWLLGKIESTKVMMISLVTPLIAVIVGAVALGETMPPQTGFGGLLILASIGLILLRKRSVSQMESR